MTRYNARLSAGESANARHRRALATMPEFFNLAGASKIDAELVEGGGEAKVLIAADHTRPLEARQGQFVLPALRFAPRLRSEPIVREGRQFRFSLIDSIVILADAGERERRAGLIEQLAALRTLTGESCEIPKTTKIANGYLAQGRLRGRSDVVTLTGLVSHAKTPQFTLHAVSARLRFEIEIDSDVVARPARVRLLRESGLTEAPVIHQSSDRLTWLAAYATLQSGRIEAYGDEAWRADLQEIDRALT